MAKSISEYLVDLRKRIDAAKDRLEFLDARGTSGVQDEMLIHFLRRDCQLGESCYLLANARLRPGLLALMRVLCEDLFLSYLISRSEEEATKYAKEVLSELARFGLINIERDRAKIVEKKTGRAVDGDRLAEVLSKIKESITPKEERRTVEAIANACGLGKVYDTAYRIASPDVHGIILNVLGPVDDEEAIRVALPGIISLLRAIVMIVNNRLQGRGTSVEEILRTLNLEKVAGK
jgi:hypothetical protein